MPALQCLAPGRSWILGTRFGDSSPVADASKALLTDLLKQVSRSFYLTLRVLPRAVRPQIGLAYLLARTTDTIADTEIIPLEKRLAALAALRARILGQNEASLNLGELAHHQGSPAERILLERAEEALALLRTLDMEDLVLVRRVIDTITSGQELDLMRFGRRGEPATREEARPTKCVIALQTDNDLDDYTYRVAGCVGEFWTKMCRAHLFPDAKFDEAKFLEDGVRFGKGLQLVNILRDLPRDLQQGRCYVPAQRLSRVGLRPEDLLASESEAKFRPVYDELLNQAEAHLAAGWEYTNTIPENQWRVRLACAWPILIGLRTLARLRAGTVLDPARPIKVSRAEVRGILVRSLIRVPFPGAFRNLWQP